MIIRWIAAPAIVALGIGITGASAAPYLQPGMQTMIQQGGVEGTVLGDIFRPYVIYQPVFVPVGRSSHRARPTSRRHSQARMHQPRAHRGMQHFTAR